jgi:hypothetical protein
VEDQDLVVERPVRIDVRFQSSKEDITLVDFGQLDLPMGPQPSKGYHFYSDLTPAKLPAMKMRVVWDGGAEGTTLSQRAASRILRAKGQLDAGDKIALVNPKRFKAQYFYGFVDTDKGGGVKVDVRMTLSLVAPCGSKLPELDVRIVAGQMDDLLVSAPDLDYLGWNRTPTSFVLASIGISIPRTDDWSLKPAASTSEVSFFADAPAVSRVLRARRTLMVPPGGALMVEVIGAETLPEAAWAT